MMGWDPRRWLPAAMVEVVLLGVLAALAYYQMFSMYAFHDDEGYMMLTVKHALAGHPLYDEVWTLYGPVYFFYKWLVHGAIGLPLTHDVVRLTAIVTWLATALVGAIVTLRLTASVGLAALVQLLVTVHLATIVSEPGHPQELAGLLTMMIVAVPAIWGDRPPTRLVTALGALVAAVTMIKVNLGILVGLAVWMSVLSLVPPTAVSITLRILSSVALMALPALLMRPMLASPQAWNFAATQALSLIAVSIVALTNSRHSLSVRELVVFVASCIGGGALIGLATLVTGTTVSALVDCLITAPTRLSTLYVRMAATYFPAPSAAAWAIALALVVRVTRRWRVQPDVLALVKLAFGIAALNAAWHQDIRFLLARLTPFVWLALLSPRAEQDARWALARLVLCWSAVLQPLQAYPVAGSQVYFGTVLHVLVGAVCIGDAVRWLHSLSSGFVHGVLRVAAVAIVLLVIALSASEARAARQRYAQQVPLDLPGATRLRASPFFVDTLHALTRALDEQSDTFLCVPGFNSLYFWTGKEPPTLDVLGHEMRLYSEDRQVAMIDALLQHQRPIVVHFHGLAEPYPPFESRLNERFKLLMKVAYYDLLVPR